jgi:hypothetical protein
MFYFLLAGQTLLVPTPSALAQNIALGKSYTLDPMPNYGWTTDSGDLTQLTDGVYTQGHFWTQTSTVGWDSTRIVVTIDLGSVQSISGLRSTLLPVHRMFNGLPPLTFLPLMKINSFTVLAIWLP